MVGLVIALTERVGAERDSGLLAGPAVTAQDPCVIQD